MKAKLDLRAPLLAAIFLVSVIGLIIAGFPLRSGASERQGRLENLPVYPGVAELTMHESRDGTTWVSRTTTYRIDADPNQVVSFYSTYLNEEGWDQEELNSSDSQILYYGWNKDVGLPGYGTVIGVTRSSDGTTEVTITQTKNLPH